MIVERETTNAERAFLFAHDTDPFNRWEAGRALARETLLAMIRDGASPDPAYLDAAGAMLRDAALDPAFRALALGLPSEDELAQTLAEAGEVPDPQAIWEAREALEDSRAEALSATLEELYTAHQVTAPYRPDPDQAGARALANTALGLITRRDAGARAQAQYAAADNMTQQLAALSCLLRAGRGAEAAAAFFEQWRHDRLVIDKWFGLQVMTAAPDAAAEVAERLTEHPDFTIRNPNRFRAVLGALAGFPAGFHHISGRGYRLLADMLIRLDPLNPQTTARMCAAFETWRRYDTVRQGLIGAEIDRILATPGLSGDTTEMLGRIRGTG